MYVVFDVAVKSKAFRFEAFMNKFRGTHRVSHRVVILWINNTLALNFFGAIRVLGLLLSYNNMFLVQTFL